MASTQNAPDPLLWKALLGELDPATAAASKKQASALGEVLRLQAMPYYPFYLLAAFTRAPKKTDISTTQASVAGLLLRNLLRERGASLSPAITPQIRDQVLPLLGAPSLLIRRTASLILVALLEHIPDGLTLVLPQLLPLLNSASPIQREAALGVCAKLVEDIPGRLEATVIGNAKPVDVLIPGWIRLTASPILSIRILALRSLIPLADEPFPAFEKHEDHFLAALFALTSDPDPTVRKYVCQAFGTLFCNFVDKLVPNMDAVIDYMLASTQDPDPTIALEACRFWLESAEDIDLALYLRPALPELVPVLLSCMVYDDADLAVLEQEQARLASGDPLVSQEYGPVKSNDGAESVEGAAEEQDGKEIEQFLGEWNVRKCSAATLDALSVRFGSELLKPLLPLLKPKLYSPDWVQREVAILALGAVAEGAYEGMRPSMPTVIPYLIKALDDRHVVVRSIACWSLGRYVRWCIGDESEKHLNTYFVPLIEGLLRATRDHSKRLHEGACSALATLEEEAGPVLVPYVNKILTGLIDAFAEFCPRGLHNVFDAITVLVDSAGSELCKPENNNALLAPLMSLWRYLGNDDEARLIPLLECLTSIAIAFGKNFLPYAPGVFQRCVVLISEAMARYDTTLAEFHSDDGRALVMDSFDLLSGLMQGLQTGAQPLVQAMASTVLPLLALCLRVPDSGVRQSALAFLGDMAMYAFDQIRPSLPPLLPYLIDQIEEDPKKDDVSVCNNATWALGEVALQLGPVPELKALVPEMVSHLVPVLLNPTSNQSLAENAAVAMGRLGLVLPVEVAPHLGTFAERWCTALWDVKDSEEKDSAFRGFCQMAKINPRALDEVIGFFALAIVRWSSPSDELNTMFASLLTSFRDRGQEWDALKAQMPPAVASRLQKRYGV